MVEMRWVERVRKDLPPEFNALSPNAKEKVLQYRYQITTAQGLSIMTDWIDVPTVTDSKV